VTSNDEKRIKIGGDPGKKPLISEDVQRATVGRLIRRDRGKKSLDVTGPWLFVTGKRRPT
jgi:hypothetical protein